MGGERRGDFKNGIIVKVVCQAISLLGLFLVWALMAPTAHASLRLLAPDPNVSATFFGRGGFSADGLGQIGTGDTVQAEVPAGSRVVQAYLYGTYFGGFDPNINFDGTMVQLQEIGRLVGADLVSARAIVTAQVAAKVGGGGGITNFAINNDPASLNGVALVVIYLNPSLQETTIAILDGAASQAGDVGTFNLAAPLDKTRAGFFAIMSLGSGHSYQRGVLGHGCGGSQFSTVDISNERLTSCAGNFDDGLGANGALITVGGVGDSTDNPSNPLAENSGEDDELYNLAPFLKQGDTSIAIKTANPSQDDNVFFAIVGITAKAIVTTEICNDKIDNDGDNLVDENDPDCRVCDTFDIDRDGHPSSLCPKCPEGISCDDFYDNPVDFGSDSNTIVADGHGQNRAWKNIFKENPVGTLNLKDLDGDGAAVANGRLGVDGFPAPGGTDWYDNPFTSDALGATLSQLADTLNDFDLDGYARADSGALPLEPAANDVNGCINPSALEGATCPAGKVCRVAAKDPATGRIPANIVKIIPQGADQAATPIEPHPWDLCEITAFYGCNREQVSISVGEPPSTYNGNTLVQAKYQCYDTEGGVAVDNNLDGKANATGAECQDRDIDGDGVINAANSDCVAAGKCDFYDNPADFGVNACDAPFGEQGRTWLDAFRQTTDDLDQDHTPVAKGRLGNRIPFFKTPVGKDWYDNPFTSDLAPLSQKPSLRELAQTLNDLDLDGYVAKSWVSLFGRSEPSESDTADVTLRSVEGKVKNIAGCIYPGAPEGTCLDCSVSPPGAGTGRVPQEKITAFVDEKKVCQLEAYYAEDKNSGEPATIITSGTADSQKPFFTITAQCKDGVDNNLNGFADSEDVSCPTIGGIVACGRHSDDPTTFVVESQPCDVCHFFFLFQRIIHWVTFRFAPILAVLLVALGGFFIATSKESADRLKLGKDVVIWAVIGYAIMLSSWIVVNSALAMFDVVTWTGLRSEKVSGEVRTYNVGMLDTLGVTIPVKNRELNGLYLTANNEARWIIDTIEPNTIVTNSWNGALKIGDAFEVTKGGWWQFSCGVIETKIPNVKKDAQVAVKVASAPIINFIADKEKIFEAGSTNLRWSIQNAETCTASGAEFWSGEKPAGQGVSEVKPPPFPREYKLILSCQGQGGTKSKEISLLVAQANPPVKTVFITSRAYSANLGGLDGADQKCQDRANTAGVQGTFKAWLSDKTHDAASRIKPSNGNSPFYLLDHKKIADSWAELVGATALQEQININEFTKEASLYEEGAGVFSSLVWTATEADGTFTQSGDSDCSGWSASASSEEKGPGLGDFMKKNSFWTKAGKNNYCDSARPLYCFETD